MRNSKTKNKRMFIFTAIMSLAAVFVCAIATAAWFQIDSQPLQTSLVTGTSGINLVNDSTYGYKITPTLGGDGQINYANTTVTKKNGSTISTTNNNLDGIDTNFDVPDQGIGYYLIEQNAENTFTYKYNDTTMATKFVSKTGGSVNAHYIASKTLATKKYRVKKYTFVNNETVYEQIPIKTTNSSQITLDASGDNATYDVTITTAGTYKIWLNYSSATDKWDLSLESISYSASSMNRGSKQIDNKSQKISRATSTSTKSNIDTGTYFSTLGVQQTIANNTSDWFIRTWGNSSTEIGYPGLKFQNDVSSGMSDIYWWTGRTTTQAKFTNVQITAWYNNGDNSTIGSEVKNWSGSAGNSWEFSVTANEYNFFKVQHWPNESYAVTYEKRSLLKVYHRKDGANTLKTTIDVWNNNSVSSSMTDAGVYEPSYKGYTFNGWFKDSACTVAFTDGYISHDTSIYAKFTLNSASTTKYTTYLYDEKGTTSNPTWSNPKAYVWGTNDYLLTDDAVVTYSNRYTHNGHYYYKFEISETYSSLLFRNGDSTGSGNQTVDLTKDDATNKYYCLDSSTNGSGYYQGTWYSGLVNMSDTFTTYVYDATNTWTTLSNIKAHCWGSSSISASIEVTASEKLTHTFYAGNSTPVTHSYYKFDIPKSYTSFNFYNGTNSGSSQTVDLTKTAGTSKYYVIDGTLSGGKQSGHWYTSLISSDYYTYYYYDNSATRKLGNNPHAYAWASSGATNNADNYSLYPYQNASWGSEVEMMPFSSWSEQDQTAFTSSHPNVLTGNVWRATVSQSYDKIIFHKASSGTANDDQTIDLTTTGHDGWFFVLTGGGIASGTNAGKWNGEWAQNVYGISLKASFFIKTSSGTVKSTIASQEIGNDYTFGIEPFIASSQSYSDYQYADTVNGILYLFEDLNAGTATWYTNEACTNQYTSSAVGQNFTLYRKFVADFTGSNYKTFYIDASHSGTGLSSTYWQNISICGSGDNDTPYFSSNDTGANWKIGSYLYRVTLPSSYTVRIANSGYSSYGGNNTTSNFAVSSTVTSDFLVINSASSGDKCSVTSCTDKATNIGTATVYVKAPDSNNYENKGTMSIGDQVSNDFVYELGIQIESGSYVYVDWLDTNSTHHYYRYAEFVDTKPSYVAEATADGNGSGYHNLLLTNYSGTARFNFYVTHGGEFSVVMVPDYGNGYYIMPYNPAYNTNTFSGAIKMSSGSKLNASYNGYYANSGEQIYIRSYIDAVDTLYKNGSTAGVSQSGASTDCLVLYGLVSEHTDVQLNTTTGVIQFGTAAVGYYDINVYNGVISISKYDVGDFFKLNPLKDTTTSVATATDIKNQKTTLIIEVKFTCNNSYESKVSLTANNPLSAYVGATLYCSATPLADPYNYLRNNYYNISSTNGVINDSNTSFTIEANSSSQYYAYIMVDYLPTNNGGNYTNYLTTYSSSIYFYLNATQYIGS